MGNFCPSFSKYTNDPELSKPNMTTLSVAGDQHNALSFGICSDASGFSCDCVVMNFLGNFKSVQNHPFVKSLKLKDLECLGKVYLKSRPDKFSIGECFFVENPYPSVRLDQFLLTSFPLWSSERRDEQLYSSLQQAIRLVQKMGYKDIGFPFFEDFLGIPLDVGCRVLLGALLDKQRVKGCKYTLLFQDHQKLDYCLRYASQFKGQMSFSSVTTEY